MARLIPRVDPKTIQNSGERLVAQALAEQLPSTCLVYHSYPWLRYENHRTTGKEVLQPGEADFIIVDPSQGILVVEVKGGTIEYLSEVHQWWRKETRQEIKDPFRQAERNKYAIRDRVLAHELFRNSGSLDITFGHAVIFPNYQYEGVFPAHIQGSILLGANDLKNLEKKIAQVYSAWCPVTKSRTLSAPELEAILRY